MNHRAGAGSRLEELDSLRGLAAVTVVVHHFLYTFPAISDTGHEAQLALLKYTPLHLLWSGEEAVLFFFLLSGFVLSLPFYRAAVPYPQFLVRRICRIYIPYIAAVAIGLIVRSLTYRGPLPDLSHWLNRAWATPLTPLLLANHTLLVTSFVNNAIVPVIWSLVHEMRLSIVFPLIMLCVCKWHWKLNLFGAYVLACAGLALGFVVKRLWGIEQDYTQTLLYVPIFVTGALLARHRLQLVGAYAGLPVRIKAGLLSGAVLCYTFRWWVFPASYWLHLAIVDGAFITAGGSLFLIAGLAPGRLADVLKSRPLTAAGKMSYSLYLFHTVCLLGTVELLAGRIPYAIVLVLALVLSAVAAALGYQYVERPSIRLGGWLAGRVQLGARTRARGVGRGREIPLVPHYASPCDLFAEPIRRAVPWRLRRTSLRPSGLGRPRGPSNTDDCRARPARMRRRSSRSRRKNNSGSACKPITTAEAEWGVLRTQ